jgi:hypothetical protein
MELEKGDRWKAYWVRSAQAEGESSNVDDDGKEGMYIVEAKGRGQKPFCLGIGSR